MCKLTRFMGLNTYDLNEKNPYILYKKLNNIFKKSKLPNLVKIPTLEIMNIVEQI